MGGIWISNTRHLDPKVPGGEGRVLAMRYQSPEPEGNRERETAGGGSSPHHRVGERWEGSGLAIPETWTRGYQEGRGGTGLCYQAPGPEGDREGDTAGGVAGEHDVFVDEDWLGLHLFTL